MADQNRTRELDQLKGQRLLLKLLADHQERVRAIEADVDRFGPGRSGAKTCEIWKSHIRRLREYVEGRISNRRELALLCPSLGSGAELLKLREELEKHILGLENAHRQPGNERLLPSILQENQQAAREIRARAKLEIDILEHEVAIALESATGRAAEERAVRVCNGSRSSPGPFSRYSPGCFSGRSLTA